MQEGKDLLDDVNKVKALMDQLVCLELPIRSEIFVMTLLKYLLPLFALCLSLL